MIYLLEDRDYLKIGYTKDLESRLKTYRLHNCYIKVLECKEGNKLDESILHKRCKKYQYDGEWYNNCEEVKKIFTEYNKDWTDIINCFISLINIRAKAIKECWKGNCISFTGLKLIKNINKILNKNFISSLKNITCDDKYNIYWRYYDVQNDIIKNTYNRSRYLHNKEYQLSDEITIIYGKQ